MARAGDAADGLAQEGRRLGRQQLRGLLGAAAGAHRSRGPRRRQCRGRRGERVRVGGDDLWSGSRRYSAPQRRLAGAAAPTCRRKASSRLGLLCALRRRALAAQARPQSQHVVLPSSCASAAHRAPLGSCRSGGDALGRRHVPGGARLPARLSGRATVRALSHVHVPPAHQPAGRALLETPHHVEPSRAERKVRQLAADGARAWSNAPPWQQQSRPPAAEPATCGSRSALTLALGGPPYSSADVL